MNRRGFLVSLAALGAMVAGSIPLPARSKSSKPLLGSRTTDPESISGSEIIDRMVSGPTDGFIVPAGEVWKIDGEVESSGNVIVEGTLVMRDGDTLRFVGIDESEFVGGGMVPLDSDVGLWVLGGGVLDIEGSPIAAWNRTGSDATWSDDHDIVLMPWEPGDSGWDPTADVSTIESYRLGDPVPEIVPGLPTEIVNLSRDVRIEGTPDGRTHVWIHSDKPQRIRHATIRHVGPQQQGEKGRVVGVHGRYGLHFHMMGDAARGSVVEGVVIRDCGGHAFVPHASHGITFRRCVAFDTFNEQFWWDKRDGNETNRTDFSLTRDVVYEECVGALARWSGPGYHGSNFVLGRTEGGAVLGCVAVGSQAWKEGSGFHWPSQANRRPNVWKWKDNLSHNHLKGGFRVWQNTKSVHDVPELQAYNCGEFGIAFGAYGAPGYHWSDFDIVGLTGPSHGSGMGFTAGIVLHAVASASSPKEPYKFPDRPDGYALSFERGRVSGADVGVYSTKHVGKPAVPTLVKNVAFERIEDAVLLVDEAKGKHAGLLDFVECTRDGRPLRPDDVRIASTKPGFRARFQNGEAWQIDEAGRAVEIAPFYSANERAAS